jgi:CheY-like chemotaxis protein
MPPQPAEPSSMSVSLRLALEGFSTFERQALQSYFRLCAARQPAFEPDATLADCSFCLVDADRPAAVEAVRAARRQSTSIYIGMRAPAGAAAHLTRPIDPRRVARALEALAGAAATAATTVTLAVADATDAQMATSRAAAPEAVPAEAAPVPLLRRKSPASPAADASFAFDVLVASDLDITRRSLAVQLERLGCRVTQAASSEQALARLAERRFRLVFADMGPTDLDGLALCQLIKQGGAGAPAIVRVGALPSPSDRVRGLLSGCDEHLARPVALHELAAVLHAHGNRRRRAR